LLKKSLAIGIILLFISSGVIPVVISDTPISTKTIYVDDDNTSGPWDGTQQHPFQFIQDGVNDSSVGDTVFVKSGIYYEQVIIDKTLNLVGENKYNTIIDGNGSWWIVRISFGDSTSITGFTVQNSRKTTSHNYRGGISCISSDLDYVTISNCVLLNNSIGVNFVYGRTGNTVRDCVFMNNDDVIFCSPV